MDYSKTLVTLPPAELRHENLLRAYSPFDGTPAYYNACFVFPNSDGLKPLLELEAKLLAELEKDLKKNNSRRIFESYTMYPLVRPGDNGEIMVNAKTRYLPNVYYPNGKRITNTDILKGQKCIPSLLVFPYEWGTGAKGASYGVAATIETIEIIGESL